MQFEDQTLLAIREAASTWRTLAGRVRPLLARCTGTPAEKAQAVDALTGAVMRAHLADRAERAAAASHWMDGFSEADVAEFGRQDADETTDFSALE